jgi:hypothetical protein
MGEGPPLTLPALQAVDGQARAQFGIEAEETSDPGRQRHCEHAETNVRLQDLAQVWQGAVP